MTAVNNLKSEHGYKAQVISLPLLHSFVDLHITLSISHTPLFSNHVPHLEPLTGLED